MNSVKLCLAKKWLKRLGGEFKEIKRVKFSDGRTKEVVMSEGGVLLGQNILFLNVILLQEKVLNKYSAVVQKFILEHEYGHAKINIIAAIAFVGLFACSSVGVIRAALYQNLLIFVLSFVLLLFGLIIWSNLYECYADYSAIKALGPEDTLKVIKELQLEEHNQKPIEKWFFKLTRLPRSFVLEINKKINKLE